MSRESIVGSLSAEVKNQKSKYDPEIAAFLIFTFDF